MIATFQENRLRTRLLSILRQKAEQRPLFFDVFGYTRMDRLISYLRSLKDFPNTTIQDVQQVIVNDPRKQIEWDGGSLIRATFGFSPSRSIVRTPRTPPDQLYYSTHQKLASQVKTVGLLPIASDLVQLTSDLTIFSPIPAGTAIFVIQARECMRSGMTFYRSDEVFYYADSVPVTFISDADFASSAIAFDALK